VAGFLEGARITALDGGTLTLEYPRNLAASARMLDRNGKRESLQQVLKNLLGEETGLRFEISEQDAELPPSRPVAPPPPAPRNAARAEPEPAPQNLGIPVTEELRVEILTQVPLAKKLAEAFGARIVKVE
jgi:hypothetical protein